MRQDRRFSCVAAVDPYLAGFDALATDFGVSRELATFSGFLSCTWLVVVAVAFLDGR